MKKVVPKRKAAPIRRMITPSPSQQGVMGGPLAGQQMMRKGGMAKKKGKC